MFILSVPFISGLWTLYLSTLGKENLEEKNQGKILTLNLCQRLLNMGPPKLFCTVQLPHALIRANLSLLAVRWNIHPLQPYIIWSTYS